MRGRGPVMCPARLVGTSNQEIWLKRGGPGKSGAGASGWKLRPSKVLAHSLAEMTRGYRSRKK